MVKINMDRPIVELIRLEETTADGTFGVLLINKQLFCFTLEPADLLNEVNVSSIPAQQYLVRRRISPKHGEVFEIQNVPGRTVVQIHILNYDEGTEGCIGLGLLVDTNKDRKGIFRSGDALKSFMKVMEGVDEFHLTIKEVY